MSTRRDFLKQSSLSVATLPILNSVGSFGINAATVSSTNALDQSVVNFWTTAVRQPSESFTKGLTLMGGPAYQPSFVRYVSPGVFLTPSQIDTKDLPDKGQVNLQLRVERFRPSQKSRTLFANAQTGSLRIDLKQTKPLPDLTEALAWTAVAAFLPKADTTQFGDLKDLTFDPGTSWGQLQQVPLSNGLGFWTWNFFLKHKDTFWGKMMALYRQGNKTVFPLLGLPGLALTALSAIDKFIGFAQANDQSDWLFKSVDSPVVATKEGQQALGDGGIPLTTGHYVIVPTDHLSAFGSARKDLDLVDGYLVQKGTDAFQLAANAATQIPTVDYLSIYVNVKPTAKAGA